MRLIINLKLNLIFISWFSLAGCTGDNQQIVAAKEPTNRSSFAVDSTFTDGTITQLFDDAQDAGAQAIALVVVANGQTYHLFKGQAFGGNQVDENTIFQAASISKTPTSVLVLKALQDLNAGKAIKDQLNDDITNYLSSYALPLQKIGFGCSAAVFDPQLWINSGNLTTAAGQISATQNSPNRQPTLAEILSHTSGIQPYSPSGWLHGFSVPTLKNFVSKPNDGLDNCTTGIIAQPGTAYSYSNLGYSVVGLTIQDLYNKINSASNSDFAALMQNKVLDPAGMTNSTFMAMKTAIGTLPSNSSYLPLGFKNHWQAKNVAMAADYKNFPTTPASSLLTTPTDLLMLMDNLRLAQGGATDKVLKPETVAEMLKQPNNAAVVGSGVLAGLGVDIEGEGNWYEHGGDIGTTQSYMLWSAANQPELRVALMIQWQKSQEITQFFALWQKIVAAARNL